MKTNAIVLLLLLWTASVAAGEFEAPARVDPAGYSARLYYQLGFGGSAVRSQSVGLRFDRPGRDVHHAPAALQWSYDARGAAIAVNGVELRGHSLISGADDDNRKGPVAWLTPGEWAAVAGTVAGIVLLLNRSGGDGGVAGSGGG